MNQRYALFLIFLTLPVVLSSCTPARMNRDFGPVPAGYLYEGPYLNIRAPHSVGWRLTGSSSIGMEFARLGKFKNESFGAQVLIFQLKQSVNKDEFILLIKQGLEDDTDSERFDVIKREFEYTEQRGYPCLNVKYIAKDTMALVGKNIRESLLLKSETLYCEHPTLENTGMAIIYSHRGPSLHNDFDAEAQDFIDGVQVPGY